MIIHQVYFWLKRPGHIEDRDRLIAGLRRLADVEQVAQLSIGIPAATEARDVVDASFDVSEQMRFHSLADQKAYQDHPLHQQFVDECSALWARVIVFDTVEV